MEFSISSPAGGDLEIIRNIKNENLPCKLPCSQTDMVNGNFGSMYFHHVACKDFSIWSSVYDIKHPTTLKGRVDIPVLEIHGSIESHLQTTWDGVDQSIQYLDQYNLSFTPHVNNTVHFDAAKRYRTLDFHPSIDLLQQYAPAYPLLDQFLNKVLKKNPCSLTTNDFIITNRMKSCLETLTDYITNPAASQFFYDAKLKEFLIMMLDQVTYRHEKKLVKPKFTPLQKEATFMARDLLVSDFSKPAVTISELVQKVGTNECTLKKCFRHLFNTSIHQYYISERMKKAKALLLDASLPVEDISLMLGYADKQNFYTDFKKHFKVTPGDWCKENNISRKDISQIIKPRRKP